MKGRVESIDALRGIFALLVLTYHSSQWLKLPLDEWALSTLRVWGVYAVEGFFVISGMALYLSASRGKFHSINGVGAFFVRRYARVLPLYALLLFVYTRSVDLTPSRIAELLMLFGFINPELSTLIGGWSIGVEFVFYFLFPMMALLMRDSVKATSLIVVVAKVPAVSLSSLFDLSPPFHVQNGLYVSPVNHFAFFASGYLLGVLYKDRAVLSQWVWQDRFALPMAVGLFLLMGLVGGNEDQIQVMGGYRRILLTMLLIFLVAMVATLALNGWLVRFLGDISYALYLMHPFVVFGLLPFLGIENKWLNWAIVYGLTIPLALITHHYFELPMQRIIRGLVRA